MSSAAPLSVTKIFVVWLENFEDHETFPAGETQRTGRAVPYKRAQKPNIMIVSNCPCRRHNKRMKVIGSCLSHPHQLFAADLLASSNTGLESSGAGRQAESPLHVIFIHGLASGLFRIHLQGPAGR